MKISLSFLAALGVTTVCAVSPSYGSLSADRISTFLSGGLTPATIQRMSPADQNVRLPLQSLSNLSTISTTQNFWNFQLSDSDFSSLFSQLPAVNHLPDPTSFIGNLHLDPALLAKIQMFIQGHNFDQISLVDLRSFIDDLHFDPTLLDKVHTFLQTHDLHDITAADVKSFIDSLNLDPALVAKLDMFLQDLANCHFNDGDLGSNQVGQLGAASDSLAAVPEPGTFALLFAGAALLGATFFFRRVR